MNQKAKDYIRRNTLDLESDNRMDSTGYVQYAISEAKAYAAIAIAEEGMRQKAIEAFKFAVDGYFIIGGTDYSASRLKNLLKNLTLNNQTSKGNVVLFPDEIMPVDINLLQQEINEGYIMLSDGRYLPPKEAVQQCYNAFGIRVGLGDNWEDIYDGWNKEMK